MNSDPRHVAVLGATGSIGCSTLDVVRASDGQLRVSALTAHSRLQELLTLAQEFQPDYIVATDADAAAEFDWGDLPNCTTLLKGDEGVQQVASAEQVDVVVAAIVGAAGLKGAWAALEAGKTLALANKETLVMGGPLVMDLAAQRQAPVLPVDSEHSAVFQAMQAGARSELQRIVLTASGGPFRCHTQQQLQDVTVEQALAHPTWDMGPKITVDSATMMNKALEIIEARWLFDLRADQIDVVVHPQSIIHSLVEFNDGSVIAQLSPPDMKLPIQYALTYPKRSPSPAPRLDLTQSMQLDFEPPDLERFPALQLGHEVAAAGGTAGAVLNAANEAAVALFLAGQLPFTGIAAACRDILHQHNFDASPRLEDLLRLDAWAREEISRWVCTSN